MNEPTKVIDEKEAEKLFEESNKIIKLLAELFNVNNIRMGTGIFTLIEFACRNAQAAGMDEETLRAIFESCLKGELTIAVKQCNGN